jgi:hypothetical protein
MKKRYLIFWMLIFFLAIGSCNRKELIDNVLANKHFRSMFRTAECVVVNGNDLVLAWYGMNEAAGYRLQIKYKSESFDTPIFDKTLPASETRITIPDLQYGSDFIARIKVISAIDTLYDSDWFGDGDDDDALGRRTGTRYSIPTIITVSEVTETSLKVSWNLKYNASVIVGGVAVPTPPIYQHAVASNGIDQFLMDSLSVTPTKRISAEPSQGIKLTQQDIDNKYVIIKNLKSNSPYTVNVFNNKIARYWDRHYNTVNLRTKGIPGAPILIPHVIDTGKVAIKGGYSRLDTIINNYLEDISLVEGTVFLLEPGKKYYCRSGVSITKGFTLKSKGPGMAQVVMSYPKEDGTGPGTMNWSVSRSPAGGEMGSIMIQKIRFEDIVFSAPDAVKGGINEYGAWIDGTGNYFFNQSSSAMEFELDGFEVENCEFTGMRRGWFRTQGTQQKVINNWTVNNCYFHDNGYRDASGGGYSFFRGDGTSPNTNIFKNVRLTNSTFLDCAMNMLFDEASGGIKYTWIGNPIWNITVENCTFVNFNTVSSKKRLFSLEGAPINSTIRFRKNLMILTTKRLAQTANPRNNYSAGMYVKSRPFTFDFGENYGTKGFLFDSDNLNSTSTGAMFNATTNPGGSTDAAVKLGAVPILPEDLMTDPDNGNLKYKNTTTVTNSEIYIKNIGDPRWR